MPAARAGPPPGAPPPRPPAGGAPAAGAPPPRVGPPPPMNIRKCTPAPTCQAGVAAWYTIGVKPNRFMYIGTVLLSVAAIVKWLVSFNAMRPGFGDGSAIGQMSPRAPPPPQ